jgi:4-amino-4-deoxy-L-arabinose transferase-like glycosyltransferase
LLVLKSFAVVRGAFGRAGASTKALLRARFDDGEGLPAAPRHAMFAARVVTLIATIWIAAISFWEIAAPFGAGHYAAATAVTTGGENMLRHGIIGAVPRFMTEPPAPEDYYCHHPWGTFWTAALFVGVFGHHEFVARLPAALMSSAMPFLLYRAGRALWGPIPGAVSAAAYVVTPITLAYANFFALEVPTMFAMALATYAIVRFSQTPRARFAVLSVFALVLGASYDWTGFVFAALVLGALFLRGFVFRRSFPSFDFERFATFWATAVCLVALLALLFVATVADLGQLGTLVAQGNARASGSTQPLAEVLASRKYWILLAFTPVAIGLGKVAAPIAFARAWLFRREGELLPIAVLVTAVLQYVGFKQGADIHFFWPQYFALYFAYALGMLAASADEIGRFALAKLERHVPALGWAVLGAGLAVALSMAPDAVRALHWARKSGGRFNEKGLIIHPDLDKAAVFAHLSKTLPEDARLGVDGSMKPSYWMDFTLEREVTMASLPRAHGPTTGTHFALDARFSPSASLRFLARERAVTAYGPFWIVDTEAPAAPIMGFSTVRREPTFFERWFVSSHHALYSVRPDPFWTWELREHLGIGPNPPPARVPDDFEQKRIAHNLAVALGDAVLAERRLGELLAGVDARPGRDYSPSVRLLGVRLERGASDVLSVYFRAGGPLAGDPGFAVTSFVEHAPPGSLVPRDELPWNVGLPFALPTSFWRPGFVYSSVTELMRRPGRERYVGSFTGSGAPVAVSGPPETTLLVLE